MGSDDTIHLGAAQVSEVYLDKEATIEKDCRYIERAADMGVDLLVFPEFHVPTSPYWYLWDGGRESFTEYYRELFENAVTVPGPAVDEVARTAAENEIAVVLGVTEKETGSAGTMYNSQVFIDDDGQVVGHRRKLRPTREERLFHTGGTGEDVRTFETAVGTLGGLMCGEHTNPLAVYSTLAMGEAIHAASWPGIGYYQQDKRECLINTPSRYHAFAGQVPVVAAAGAISEQLVEDAGLPAEWAGRGGPSSIISPMGEFLAGPKWEGEGIVHAEVDLGDRTRAKSIHDVVGHYNRFDVFSLEVDASPRTAIHVTDRSRDPAAFGTPRDGAGREPAEREDSRTQPSTDQDDGAS